MVELFRAAARLESALRSLKLPFCFIGGIAVQHRASKFTFARGIRLTTCSAEDLIVLKAFADRAKDWGDIEAVCQRQKVIDWAYVERQLGPLVAAKEAPEILDRLLRLRSIHTRRAKRP